jgi:MFS family permease
LATRAARNKPIDRTDQSISTLRAVVGNENVRRLELAWGAAIAAEWAHFVALGVFAYSAGGTSAVGIAGLVRLLPAAVVAPFAATLGDRFPRERFLTGIALAGCAALACSSAAFYAGRNEAVIFALAGLVGITSTLFRPAQQALLPSLARTPAELIASNGATSTIESLGTLVGPVLAGLLLSFADAGVVFAAAAAALLVAAGLLARVAVEGRIQVTATPGEGMRRLVAGGFETVASAAKPRLIVGLLAAQGFVRGCLNVLVVVAVFRLFHADRGLVGYLTAALGVGGLVGAAGALRLEGRRLGVPLGLAVAFWGLPIALIGVSSSVAAAASLLAIVGAANSVEDVAAFTLLQRIVDDQVLTRVLGVAWGLVMAAVALGSIAAAAIVGVVGLRWAFVVVGLILPLLALLSWRALLDADRTTRVPAAELDLVDSVPLFAPLSVAAKEHMATKLVELPVAKGEVVIRAGDAGDRFFVVADGEFEIATDVARAKARPGDFFGEIALLHDVPRTATIRATAASHLYALDRADFLAAVTGHSAVRAAGKAIAEERLGRDRRSPAGA